MEGPRAARLHELPLVEKLANEVFRSGKNNTKTMFQEYPQLYSEENLDNIRIIMNENVLVANTNYLPQVLSVYGCNIQVASLGGVCTHENFRGHGYSTKLMEDCIQKIRSEQTNLLIISGDRSMYRNAGSLPAGKAYEFDIGKDMAKVNISNGMPDIREFDNRDFNKVAKLYQSQPIRFIRKFDQYQTLLNSKKFLGNKYLVKKLVTVWEEDRLLAFIVLILTDKKAEIVDYSVSNGLMITELAVHILDKFELNRIKGNFMSYEKENLSFCKDMAIPLTKKRFPGTIKIIHFENFMNSLKPYFYEIYDNAFIRQLKFKNGKNGASVIYMDQVHTIESLENLNDILFGSHTEEDPLKNVPNVFKDFYSATFPLPIPYLNNLNSV